MEEQQAPEDVMPVATDNFDLQIRRKRLGLTQRDVMKALDIKRTADISDFENGHRDDLPNGKGRAEYEAYLSKIERERGAGR